MLKCENCFHKKVCINGANYKNAKSCKHYMPAADVQEVRHGHWIECDYKKLEHGFIENFPDKGLYCSNCRTGFKKVIYGSRIIAPTAEQEWSVKKREISPNIYKA